MDLSSPCHIVLIVHLIEPVQSEVCRVHPRTPRLFVATALHAQSLASCSVLHLPPPSPTSGPHCSQCAHCYHGSMPEQLGWVAGAHVSHVGAAWLWKILPPQDSGWQNQRQQTGQGMLFHSMH